MHPVTPRAVNAPWDGVIMALVQPIVSQHPRDRTPRAEVKSFVNVVILVLVEMLLNNLVPQACTPTTRVPFLAFPVHRVNFQIKQVILNASNVLRGIYNLNRNNQHVIQLNPGQSWPKEDLPRSSYHSGLKLMPLRHPDLKRVKSEQLATCRPMNCVKIAPLEHPAPAVPPRVNPATWESLTTTTVVLVKVASKKRFKIKVPARRAKIAQQDGNNPPPAPPPAPASIGKPRPVAIT